MSITPEQAEQIKEQLLKQLENFPEDKREEIKEQVTAMSGPELEEFLKQNKIAQGQEQQCIFCSIVDKKTPSVQIDEDEENIAILELNPLSKAHTLIIPKIHTAEPSQKFAKKVAAIISEKLHPEKIQIKSKEIMNHKLIEIIPKYKDQKQEKKQATEQELKSLQELLTKNEKPKSEEIKKTPEKEKSLPVIKPRIP